MSQLPNGCDFAAERQPRPIDSETEIQANSSRAARQSYFQQLKTNKTFVDD